jgi:hypothetical protein
MNGWVNSNRPPVSKANALIRRRSRRYPSYPFNTCGLNFPLNRLLSKPCRLHELSQLTWQKIMQAGKYGQGCSTRPRNAIASIPSCIPEDTDILSFRFNGNAPMVGFRRHEVFFIRLLSKPR